ncbi:MAG: peptidylprolyl isomerase [Cyanobium sp.]
MTTSALGAPAILPLDLCRNLARLGLLRDYIRAECLDAAVGGVELTNEEIQQARLLFARELQLPDQAALDRYARAQVLTPQALEAEALRPARQAKFSQREFGAKAEARFLERKTQLDRVVYSLLRLQDPGLARELYLRIEEGEANFADLAAEYAEGPEKATRGIVGPVPLTQAHPLLVDRLRTASPGVVLEPFPIESWWLVVRLESMTPASFDQPTASRMVQELFELWLNGQVEQRLEILRGQLLVSA